MTKPFPAPICLLPVHLTDNLGILLLFGGMGKLSHVTLIEAAIPAVAELGFHLPAK